MIDNQRARYLILSLTFPTLLLVSPQLGRSQAPSPFLGSVPTGQATGTTLDLSLKDAIERALKYNLAVIEGGQNIRAAQAVRLRSLNALLPNLSARLSGTLQQIDLRAGGLFLRVPGFRIP